MVDKDTDHWMQVQTMEQYVVFPGASGLRLGPQLAFQHSCVCVSRTSHVEGWRGKDKSGEGRGETVDIQDFL